MKKKLGVLILFSSLLLAEKNDLYLVSNDNTYPKIGIGTKFDNFSLEAVYKKNLKGNETDLNSYFKNGNAIGLNFTYVIGDGNDSKTSDNFTITNFTNSRKVKKDINSNYKLESNDEIKKTIQNITKLSSVNDIKFKVEKDINNNERIKTSKILLNHSKKLIGKYGYLNKNDVITVEKLSKTNKIVITFENGVKDGK